MPGHGREFPKKWMCAFILSLNKLTNRQMWQLENPYNRNQILDAYAS